MDDRERGRKLASMVERAPAFSESAGQHVPTGATRNGPVAATIQARLDSCRLPGKSMAEIEKSPRLGPVIDRVKRARLTDRAVVATSASAFGRRH